MADASPLGKGDLFHTEGLELPRPIREVAHALMREEGFTKDHAIATAISRGKRWAAGGNAKWVKAIADWEAAKAKAHATPNKGDRSRVDASHPEHTREVLMAVPPQFKKGKKPGKGTPPPGPKTPRKIASPADVAAAASAVSKVPPALQGKAKARVVAAARAVGPEGLAAIRRKKGKTAPKGGKAKPSGGWK